MPTTIKNPDLTAPEPEIDESDAKMEAAMAEVRVAQSGQPPPAEVKPEEKKVEQAPSVAPTKITDFFKKPEPSKEQTSGKVEEPEIKLPEKIGTQTRLAFDAQKAQTKEWKDKASGFETQISELNKQLESTKAGLANDPRVKQLESLVEQLSQKVMETDARMLPQIQDRYVKPMENAKNRIKSIAGDAIGSRLVLLYEMPESDEKNAAIDAELSQLPTHKQSQVAAAQDRYQEAKTEYDSALKHASDYGAQIKQGRAAEMEKTKAQFEQSFKEIGGKINDDNYGLFFFRKKEGDDAWNKQVEETQALAEHLYKTENDPKKLAYAAYLAAQSPRLIIELKNLAEYTASLEKQLQDTQKAQPKVSGTQAVATKKDKDFFEGMDNSMAEISTFLGRR